MALSTCQESTTQDQCRGFRSRTDAQKPQIHRSTGKPPSGEITTIPVKLPTSSLA